MRTLSSRLLCKLILSVLALVSPPQQQFVQAQVDASLTPVECPSDQTTFVATTELVFEGRQGLLSKVERLALKNELIAVYNGLTAAKCDAYFRKIMNISFIQMSNSLNETVTPETVSHGHRALQSTTISAANSSVVPTINLVYEVQGSCRDCEVSRTGSFILYDDAFRFRGRRHLRMRVLSVRELPRRRNATAEENNWDCFCETGKTPTTPQAPGVRECVDLMNDGMDSWRDSKGLFVDVKMEDLLQLDDLTGVSVTAGINSSDVRYNQTTIMPGTNGSSSIDVGYNQTEMTGTDDGFSSDAQVPVEDSLDW